MVGAMFIPTLRLSIGVEQRASRGGYRLLGYVAPQAAWVYLTTWRQRARLPASGAGRPRVGSVDDIRYAVCKRRVN